jgi:hypothetical protein
MMNILNDILERVANSDAETESEHAQKYWAKLHEEYAFYDFGKPRRMDVIIADAKRAVEKPIAEQKEKLPNQERISDPRDTSGVYN